MLAKPLIHLDAGLLHACGNTTVVTASERVRTALLHAYDSRQTTDGLRTWKSARVLTLGAFLRQCHAELVRNGRNNRVLLGTHSQRLAWLDHSPAGVEIDLDGFYDDVARAWQIVHDWDLPGTLDHFIDNDSQRLFRDWATNFRRAAERHRWLTEAELPDLIAGALRSRILATDAALFVGFDVVPPSLTRLIEALRAAGADAHVHDLAPLPAEQPRGIACEDSEHELARAILWARDVLLSAKGPVAIGIAVPNVVARYDRIVRQLDSLLRPSNRNPDPAPAPYNISGGVPLTSMPVVSTALELLRWLIEPAHHTQVESLLRSPFLRLDAAAPQSQHHELGESYGAAALIERFGSSPLRAVLNTAKTLNPAPLADTISRIRTILAAAGWPNATSLTSEAYQSHRAFVDLLEELTTSDGAFRPRTFADALAIIGGAARRCLFAPARPNAPLQVLGYLETAHLLFTHLWVVGLSDVTWPGAPQPNPYIPLHLLRRAGAPRIDSDSELKFAQRLTDHWRRAAQHIVFSHPRVNDETPCRPSPLTGETFREIADPGGAAHPYLIPKAAIALDVQDDGATGPVVVAKLRNHGSEILRDQSACPFRAFARYRLGLTQRPSPHSFPDATERGIATHVAVHETYERLGVGNVDRPEDLETSVAAAVAVALSAYNRFPRLFIEAEHKRLTRLLLEWMRFEQGRLPSRFMAGERAASLTLGAMTFQLRIDRIDELQGGGLLLIDYKTGASEPSAVFGERPEEPQLAMYALCFPNVEAIAVARVKHDDCRISGWSNPSHPAHAASNRYLRAPPSATSWHGVLESWRKHLTQLSDEFGGGAASVSPRDAKACRECDLHALCRVRESMPPAFAERDD